MDTAAPLANLITLGVQDFQRERDFYQALGWPIAFDSDDFVAFELQGVVLTLFPLDKLAADSRARPEVGQGGIRFSVIISVNTPEEVDRLADRARAAGAVVTKPPTEAEFFEGRDAYFSDPEGNFWEIASRPPTIRWSSRLDAPPGSTDPTSLPSTTLARGLERHGEAPYRRLVPSLLVVVASEI